MKIKKIKFNNHNVLKNLEVDFTDENGNPLDIIVFIGDNGTGKTQLLKSIVDVIEYLRIKVHAFQVRKDGSGVEIFDGLTTLVMDRIDGFEAYSSHYISEKNNIEQELLLVWMPEELSIGRVHGTSRIRKDKTDLGGAGKLIEYATEWQLEDVSDYIIKLIDDALYENMDKVSREVIADVCEEVNDIFKILDLDVKLSGASAKKDKVPKFKNSLGDEFDIRSLSSGEKQLFFRILFLKRLNVNNAIILIDEPETSLHPEWQRKIIEIYKQIGENNQLILATHSPFIVGSVPSESIRIMQKSKDGYIEVEQQDENDRTYGKSVEDILKVTMDLDSLRDEKTTEKLDRVSELLEEDSYDSEEYQLLMKELKAQLGTADRDIMRIEMAKSIKVRQNAKSK